MTLLGGGGGVVARKEYLMQLILMFDMFFRLCM
jgi:hypothetical protein